MESITITRGEEILAHHTTVSALSHYGQPVWVVENESPDPGPATWEQAGGITEIDIIGLTDGWLIARQSDGLIVAIIWSDGSYYAGCVVDQSDQVYSGEFDIENIPDGAYVQGTVPFPGNPLGCIF